MDRRLDSKVAINTGGTGIGEAIAYKFAKESASVVVNGLSDYLIEKSDRLCRRRWKG